jgi:fatty acid desaturase
VIAPVVEHAFVVWLRIDESQACGFGASPAGVVVGVDAAEERPDIGDGGVVQDRVDRGVSVAVSPSGRVDDVGEAHRGAGVFIRQQGAMWPFAVVAHPPVVDIAADERDRCVSLGGLNYQIEHHLFPNMPRPNLRRARPIIRQCCEDNGLPYSETSLLGSYRQVLHHLHTVGRVG